MMTKGQLKEHYRSSIIEWIDRIKLKPFEPWEDPDRDPDDDPILCHYVGTIFSNMPSGKYYMPWTSNQTHADTVKDSLFIEALEEELEKNKLFLEYHEENMYFCKIQS